MSTPSNQPNDQNVTQTEVTTPKAKKPKAVLAGILIFLAFVALMAITMSWLSYQKREAEKSKRPTSFTNDFGSTGKTAFDPKADIVYDMSDIAYGDSIVFVIEPGHSARVDVTNEWTPCWSSAPIHVWDNFQTERVLSGNSFIKGPGTGDNITFWFYQNKTQNSITVKSGRCKSLATCTIHF